MTGGPSLHQQLLFLPTAIGTVVFVMAGLDVSGEMHFFVSFYLLCVTAIPFLFTYASLFPVQPRRLREAKFGSSVLLLALQVAFWVTLIVIASYWRRHLGG